MKKILLIGGWSSLIEDSINDNLETTIILNTDIKWQASVDEKLLEKCSGVYRMDFLCVADLISHVIKINRESRFDAVLSLTEKGLEISAILNSILNLHLLC